MVPRNRKGFTLIELLTVVTLLGVLASIASMRYISLENEGLAAKVGSEMQEIRLAGINYFSEHEVWPAAASAGVTPTELVSLLSGATQFTTPNYTLEWVNQGEDLIVRRLHLHEWNDNPCHQSAANDGRLATHQDCCALLPSLPQPLAHQVDAVHAAVAFGVVDDQGRAVPCHAFGGA